MKATTYLISIIYQDNSFTTAKVTFNEPKCQSLASAMMIAQGWLQTSSAIRATIYDKEGNHIASYK